MSSPRDYSIEIRNEQDFHYGKNVQDRHYAKMGSSPSAAEEGSIKLRIGRSLEVILTAEEARRIGETLVNAAQGAMPKLPESIVAVLNCFSNGQAAMNAAGVDLDGCYLDLTLYTEAANVAAAEEGGFIRRIVNPQFGPQDIWKLTPQGYLAISDRQLIL